MRDDDGNMLNSSIGTQLRYNCRLFQWAGHKRRPLSECYSWWRTVRGCGKIGTAVQPHPLAYVSDRTLTTIYQFGHCGVFGLFLLSVMCMLMLRCQLFRSLAILQRFRGVDGCLSEEGRL